jgi:hypothetical protein
MSKVAPTPLTVLTDAKIRKEKSLRDATPTPELMIAEGAKDAKLGHGYSPT